VLALKEYGAPLFFDSDDYTLLAIVNDVLKRPSRPKSLSSLMAPYMHPHGIKEMAAPSGLRIAYAIAGLLESLDIGKAADRIIALRSLRDEVFSSSAGYYRKNTARVLVQIMKELIRSQEDRKRQLQLAHDFRVASSGKPSRIRSELARYHLLEMPEEWNQYAFDDHVHDANTKGRKSPTHLIMDAWIKGIRKLTVIYYNYVEEEVVAELLEASALLDIRVRIGIEFSTRFRTTFVRFIWELEGFLHNRDLLEFLREKPVREMMASGREVSRYQQQYVLAVLEAFNSRHRQVVETELGLAVDPIQEDDFLRFVGAGQPSLLHLAKYIEHACRRGLDEAMGRICRESPRQGGAGERELAQCAALIHELVPENIINRFLHPRHNPDLHDPTVPHDSGMPTLLELSPAALIDRLAAMHASSRFTLNLSQLSIQDTLELLYVCKGRITHLESFNLKDSGYGIISRAARGSGFAGEAVDIVSPDRHYRFINTLQQALNEENVIILKRAIRSIIYDFERTRLLVEQGCENRNGTTASADLAEKRAELAAMNEQKAVLLDILQNIAAFHGYYQGKPLGSRIGTGSTGQSHLRYGMGLVVVDTLPRRAQRMVRHANGEEQSRCIPVTAKMVEHHHIRRCGADSCFRWRQLVAWLPGLRKADGCRSRDWSLERFDIHPGTEGNIVTLGGIRRKPEDEIRLLQERGRQSIGRMLPYLNTHLKNTLKIVAGFVPAFLTFSLTKDWWVLAYLGAFIWFGITGLRNIIQSVLGGGGLQRSPLLPWNSLVSWSRIADSLLYTGFSVPLLDYVVKTLLLQQSWGVTTATAPVLLYAVMALANGIYISAHNVVRGLPRSAIIGNFFRSILSIPLAVLFNVAIAMALQAAMIPDVDMELQKWAAIISKLASDCVAGVIEGLADRARNIRIRLADYREKISRLFAVFARLDVLFPEEDVLDLLLSPKKAMSAIRQEARELEKAFIVNALDLMYIWMYQPRARKALELTVAAMSLEEWLIFYRSQLILKRHKEISRFFIDGLVGKNFTRALAFYLDRKDAYLEEMARIGMLREKMGP
jgi:hypothetical protein